MQQKPVIGHFLIQKQRPQIDSPMFFMQRRENICVTSQLRQFDVAAELALIYPKSWINQYPPGSTNPIRRMLERAHNEYQVNLHPMELWSTGRGDHTWANSLTKLHIFGLTNYTRIVYLDSDGIVLNNLDHLFLAPQSQIALPRAYWLEQGKLASHIMLVTPSDTLMNRVRGMANVINGFDMEVINKISSSSALILPHRRYALLTGEFRKTDHSSYLSDEGPDGEWNPQAELSNAFFVHFSDWPLPKPWIKAGANLVESTQPACDPKEKVECWNRSE
ncbi:Glucose N-acetyltransferase 1 [Rhizoctonia solani]|uniref:Glucose N-acetyltransferase 1 n=1 Tax=Rhizoctonia solani TaxID=456999 RepID=A0A0K6FRU8_9AGAM|nr:Glucose N-acetyltransferase 1 [Rhizoctonia solani]